MRLRREPEPSPETSRALAAARRRAGGRPVERRARRPARSWPSRCATSGPRRGPSSSSPSTCACTRASRARTVPGSTRPTPAQRRELHTPRRLRTTPLALGTAASIFIVATAAAHDRACSAVGAERRAGIGSAEPAGARARGRAIGATGASPAPPAGDAGGAVDRPRLAEPAAGRRRAPGARPPGRALGASSCCPHRATGSRTWPTA